jgi:sec-independent protein translocase protein TatC
VATPVILYQFARFVLPGLYPQERKVLLPFVAASVVLLMLGMGAGYFLMPKSLEVLSSFGPSSFTELFSPAEYMSFFIKMLLAFGLAAEFPLILIFLQLTGILTSEMLRKNRRVAFVIVVIIAAIITPTGDPFTLFVVALPMYLFYEISIIVGKRMGRRRQAALST